jgi:hypothetical protein
LDLQQTRKIKDNAAFAKDFDEMCQKENELRTVLEGEQKDLFIDYVNLWGTIVSDLEFDSYRTGFIHGAKFSFDIYNDN